MNLRQTDHLLRVHRLIIISLFRRIRNEYIDANLLFGLETVGGKPTQIIVFVDDVHIIIIR